MEVQVGVAKVNKWAMSESGDTLEMIERPHGGLTFVLVDGQRSGKSAKAISNVVARKAIALVAEGVRDGAAARAAHDYLYTHRGGKVSATLNIVSLDLDTRTLVISRNNPIPVFVIAPEGIQALDEGSEAVGVRKGTKPVISEFPLQPGLSVIVYTDGLIHAGDRKGRHLDLTAEIERLCALGPPDAPRWADELLSAAMDLDDGRPIDDISVLVVAVLARTGDEVRRLSIRLPL